MTSPPPIEIERLALAFEGRTVLEDFSLRVAAGEKVVLAGPSGSGKSSILACLLGFLVPAAGRIAVQGEALDAKSVWRLRRAMALVQQEPALGEQTVQAWIEEPFAFHANEALRDHLARLPDWLARLRLPPGILRQKGSDLSGGEKQRVALAAALLLDRPILLLDEPASALDPDSRQAVYAALAGLRGQTLLMISHDVGPALDFADRTVRIAPREIPHGRA
ncbi:MAG: ATP-binding cassette domain-containing protein [Opitutae bacterium]|nr:ATP-binding cassette domain-containing protein [Opitutae bacterium]